MVYRWFFTIAWAHHVALDDVIENCSPRYDRVASRRIVVGSKETRDKLTGRPFRQLRPYTQ